MRIKMRTMFFHRSRLLQLGAVALVTVCVFVYRMSMGLASPHHPVMIDEAIHHHKLPLSGNTSFLHPHVIMKTPSGRGRASSRPPIMAVSQADGKVRLPQQLELQQDTSIILPIGNGTRRWVQMKTLKPVKHPAPSAPKCPDTFQPDLDIPLLDSLRHCSSNMTFQPDLEIWLHTEDMMCEGRIYMYHKEGILLRDVVLDRSLWTCRDGGEDLRKVWNHTTPDEELCKPDLGAFKLYCDDKPVKFFKGDVHNHLSKWLEKTVALLEGYVEVDTVVSRLTIAVQRYEYHNLYHSLSELYNTYLVMKFYDMTPDDVDILVIDGHPRGLSDSLWTSLFPHTTRISALRNLTLFQRMFWNPQGHHSVFVQHTLPSISYVEEFRSFILDQFGLEKSSSLDCGRVRVTLISRKDYVAGNHNPHGVLQRKIKNEDEIIETINKAFPTFVVDNVRLEKYNLKDQLELMVNTDILIGMHGAGMTHTLFLPGHAGVVELIPAYWRRSDGHFQGLARWRKLAYTRWENRNPDNEIAGDQYTYVPPYIILDRVRQVMAKICPPSDNIIDL